VDATFLADLAVILLTSGALYGIRGVIERRRARRELRALPRLTADTAEGTIARVVGRVRVIDEVVVAPLTEIECVVSRSRVELGDDYASKGKRVHEQFAMVPFSLERDGDGPIRIEGVRAELDMPVLPGSRQPERARREELLRRLGLPREYWRAARFEETAVRAGDRVWIAGLVMLDPGEAPTGELGHRDATPSRLRIAGNADHPLVIGEA